VTADIIVTDEWLGIEVDLRRKVIMPLMLMDQAVLITLTTPTDKPSPDDSLFDKDDPIGAKYITVFRYSAVCPDCELKGLTKECPHMPLRIPKWQSERKMVMVDELMSMHKEDKARELYGITGKPTGAVFDRPFVTRWFRTTPYDARGFDVPYIFVAIDPNTGKFDASAKETSDFAMFSYYEAPDRCCVVQGLESIAAVRHGDWDERLQQHLLRLMAQPHLRAARLVAIIENNLGQQASHIAAVVKATVPNSCIMYEKDLREGVHTTGFTKKEMMVRTAALLEANKLRIDRDVVSTGDRDELLGELQRQTIAYKEHRKVLDPVVGRVSITYSGKGAGKDDLCVAMQLAFYWAKIWMDSPRYLPYR
jgi:hypothetical protein